MGHIQFNNQEKEIIGILKDMLGLVVFWKNEMIRLENLLDDYELLSDKEIEMIQRKLLLYFCNLLYLENLILKSGISEDEINILKDVFIEPIGNNEKVGQKYFYSESGIRNKVNGILKKLLKVMNI